MIPHPVANSSSQFLFQKVATVNGFLCNFSETKHSLSTQVSLWICGPLYQWCIIPECFDLMYLRDLRICSYEGHRRSPRGQIQGHLSVFPYPQLPGLALSWVSSYPLRSFAGSVTPPWPPNIILLAPSLNFSLPTLTPWMISSGLDITPILTTPDFISLARVMPWTPDVLSNCLLESPSDVWPMTQTETVRNGTPDLSPYLFTSCCLPHFNSIFPPSCSDPKPQTSTSSFLLSNPISHPLANPINSSFKQYPTSSHHLRCYLGLSHHQSLPRLLQ